jgi:hypothetical protein
MKFPAVRLIRTASKNPVVTGPADLIPLGPVDEPAPVVSFAYQIDQEVLEGEVPPRREGMFVPYRECWQQFIDHLDGFVARQPLETDTFYAVRLDISGFFDNLPRYAVDNVLQKAMGDAAESHFSGLSFADEVAPLLASEAFPEHDAGNRHRAEFLATWLADQSFGFRYFDPSDGRLTRTPNPTTGIPQGLDLSAFLANLSLFPLDRAVSKFVEDERRARISDAEPSPKPAVVYGRYVDDMVIITTSQAMLSNIEGLIGEQLLKIQLATNAKHERTKAMNRRGIREWLLGERGAAVLVSAGGEDTPTTGRARVDDLLAVGPDTSRGHVLQLLHHVDLYAPKWASEQEAIRKVESTLKRLRDLPSIKLRYYDWVSAARWCLHSLALRRQQASAREFADELHKWWRGIYRRDVASQGFGEDPRNVTARQVQLDLAPILMMFDALERSIDSRYDRSGRVDPGIRHALRSSREHLTALVREQDLCGVLLSMAAEQNPDTIHNFATMLRIQSFGIRGLAASGHHPKPSGSLPMIDGMAGYAERRFALNALEQQIREYAAPLAHGFNDQRQSEIAEEAEPLLALHEAIARLAAHGTRNMTLGAADRSDPLSPTADVIIQWVEGLSYAPARAAEDALAATHIAQLANQFLELPYLPGELLGAKTAALPAFVEIVAGVSEGLALLAARHHLVKDLAKDDSKAIAVPPGVDELAFFARADEALRAYAFRSDEDEPASEDAIFGVQATIADDQGVLTRLDCVVPQSHRLAEPQEAKLLPKDVTARDLRNFAKAYRELADEQSVVRQDSDENGARRPLTPFHLLAPTVSEGRWASFGAYSRLPVGPQAFVRLGHERLHSVAVHANGAHLWQVGFTLADHLGYRGFARSSEIDRLIVGTLEPNDDAESIPFYVMQLTIPRLCGAFIARSRFQIRPERGLPSNIERQLTRLESFDDANPNSVVHLGHLLEASAEARAAELLRESPAPLAVAGALSAVFTSVARAASRSERIFAQNLPRPHSGIVTHRRTVDLWLDASSRLDGLLVDNPSIGLRTAAAGMRVVAIARLAQTLTLEVWSLLSDEDIARLAYFAPDPTDLGLPEEILLVGGRQSQRSPVAGDQVVQLIATLTHHAGPGAAARDSLGQITPLGWVVALATVTGLLELKEIRSDEREQAQRPELLAARAGLGRSQSEQNQLWECLTTTAEFLARSVDDGVADDVHAEEWPWLTFSPFLTDACSITEVIAAAARSVEALYGLRAKTCESRFFQISDQDDRGYCLVSRESRGRQNIAGWQIDRDSLGATRLGDLETQADAGGGDRFIWSETTIGDRVVSLSIAYRSLAQFARGFTSAPDRVVLDDIEGTIGVAGTIATATENLARLIHETRPLGLSAVRHGVAA